MPAATALGLLLLMAGAALAQPAVPPLAPTARTTPKAAAPKVAAPPASAPITPAPISAPPPASGPGLSLEDAIRLTLRSSNNAIRIEDEKVNSATGKLKEASGVFDWTVSGEGGYETLYVPHIQQGLIPNRGVLTDQTDTLGTGYISGGIGKEFRNGISVRPGLTAYPSSQASVAQTLGQTQFRPSLGIQIPLLKGFGETATDALERSAQENLRGTGFAREFAITSLVNDVVQTYWRCLASDEIAQNTEEADRRATAYENSLHQQAGRGLIEPTIAQRASAIAVSRRLSVEQAEDQAAACHRDLAAATVDAPSGQSVQAQGALPRMEGLGPMLDHLNEDALESLALENRADAKAARESVAAAEAKLDGARDGLSPSLSLNLEPDRAIMRYSQSIENNSAEGQLAEASADTSQARITLNRLEIQIRQQVSDSLRALRRAYSDWAMLNEAAQQMDVVVIDAQGRARLGVTDQSDFVSAQNQRANIRNQLVNARLQYVSSLAALRLATGTISPDSQKADALAAEFVSPDIHS
jgi:outer membrane protein TolC